jgi:hypothetical protein
VAVEEGVVGEAMRHVDKGTGDTGGTPEDDPVGGSERQVDKETVGLSDPPTRSSSLVTPTSHPTVWLSTCFSDPPTRSSSLMN